MTYTEACIIINMIPRMGPVRLRRLLDVFGEPQAILRAPAARLASVEGIGPEIARGVAAWESEVDLPAELARVKDASVSVLTTQSEHYPPALRTIYDPPIVLYVWGELCARDARGVGVVGSRRTTFYGVETARKLSTELAMRRADGVQRPRPRHRHRRTRGRAGREGPDGGGPRLRTEPDLPTGKLRPGRAHRRTDREP